MLTESAQVLPSKEKKRKMTQQGALSIDKEKVTDANAVADLSMLLNDKFILVQRGKKNYFLLIVK